MHEISLKTDRRTQLLDITDQVEQALNGANGAAAALVYVPHTTAGVTINDSGCVSKTYPNYFQDLEKLRTP